MPAITRIGTRISGREKKTAMHSRKILRRNKTCPRALPVL
jgi:hypothetical protein